jgi:CheY-like chemotaxis protein
MPTGRKVVAVVEDLFFTVKILDAAKRAGLAIEFVKSAHDALLKAAEHPALMLFDLNFAAIDPLHVIAAIKSDAAMKSVRLVGYVSHVQADLKKGAQAAGCDIVLARSALSQNLPKLMMAANERE